MAQQRAEPAEPMRQPSPEPEDGMIKSAAKTFAKDAYGAAKIVIPIYAFFKLCSVSLNLNGLHTTGNIALKSGTIASQGMSAASISGAAGAIGAAAGMIVGVAVLVCALRALLFLWNGISGNGQKKQKSPGWIKRPTQNESDLRP